MFTNNQVAVVNINKTNGKNIKILFDLAKTWWHQLAIFFLSLAAIFLIAIIIITGFYYFESVEQSSSYITTTTLVTKITGKLENQTDCGRPSIKGSIELMDRLSVRRIGRIMNGENAVTNRLD
jgi:hypothetical protein